MTTEQPMRSRTGQGAGTTIVARYGELEWSDSVEILQGSRCFGLERYVSHWWVCCPIHPYRADLFSDARTGADPCFCGVLADLRDGLLPLAGQAVDASDGQKKFNAGKAQPKAH